MPTLEELYFTRDGKRVSVSVWVGTDQLVASGIAQKPGLAVSWSYTMGQAPTAEVVIPGQIPAYVTEYVDGLRPPITIDVGFNGLLTRVFTGRVNTVDRGTESATLRCSGFSARIEASYERNVVTLAGIDASTAVANLLDAAGVQNYVVDLPAWTIGSVVAQDIDFSSYGEAINRIAEVDGSPWYEMPSGQVRVDVRDPLPANAAWRTYFSGNLDGETLNRPPGADPTHYPRIVQATITEDPRATRNKVTVRGASVTETNPSTGEETTTTIESECDGTSDLIPNPPQYVGAVFQSELIDTDAKAASVCLRHLNLYNRKHERMSLIVSGDPEAFLGATIRVLDPVYTGTSRRWFVEAYSSSISAGQFTTNYNLLGSPGGTGGGQLDPFADFIWSLQYDPPPAEGFGPPPKFPNGPPSGGDGDEKTDSPENDEEVARCLDIRPRPGMVGSKIRNTIPDPDALSGATTPEVVNGSVAAMNNDGEFDIANDTNEAQSESTTAFIMHIGYDSGGPAAVTGFGGAFLTNAQQLGQISAGNGIATLFMADCAPYAADGTDIETAIGADNFIDRIIVYNVKRTGLTILDTAQNTTTALSVSATLGAFADPANLMFAFAFWAGETAGDLEPDWAPGDADKRVKGATIGGGADDDISYFLGWGVNVTEPGADLSSAGNTLSFGILAVEVNVDV